jgi:MHS family proline/betaine transporter-like MFS transporter
VTFLTVTVGLERAQALVLAVAGLGLYAAMCPLARTVGDRIGRRPTMIAGAAGLALAAIPCFALIATGHPALVLVGLVVFGAFESLANVMLGVLLVELFPAETRVSGSAIGFNVAQAVVGGPGPLVAAGLAAAVAISFAPALYVAVVALAAAVGLFLALPETGGARLSAAGDARPGVLGDRHTTPQPMEASVASATTA